MIIDEADVAGQDVDGADATRADAAAAVGDRMVDVPRSENRLVATGAVGLVQAALDAPLAVGQFPAYAGFHLKSLQW
jgi:hypothetical protein